MRREKARASTFLVSRGKVRRLRTRDDAKTRPPFQMRPRLGAGLCVLIGSFGEVMPSRRHGDEQRPIARIGNAIGQGQALCRGPAVVFHSTHGTLHAVET